MARIDELLGVDFDGNPVADPGDVIYRGLDDSRHQDRVPALTALLNDDTALEDDRFLACLALTVWAEPAGYQAVVDATANPKQAPWYDIRIDRMYSVDNTFARLAAAVDSSDVLAKTKGTRGQRTEALRALVRIADTEYFDGKLEYALDPDSIVAIIDDITAVVRRGVRSLAAREPHRFDVATQLVDLAAAVATVDEPLAVDLGMEVVAVDSSYRVLNHAVAIVDNTKGSAGRTFGEYLAVIGDEKIRQWVAEALASREGRNLAT
jgi:hypothetical protein